MKPGIFISYRESDASGWAVGLRDDLVRRFGESNVFLDRDALRAGPWRVQIEEALARCGVVLVVIGKGWLAAEDDQKRRRLWLPDDVLRHEIQLALSAPDVRVIPVLVGGAPLPRSEELPEDLRPLLEQQSREIGAVSHHREGDLQLLSEDIERATGLQPSPILPLTRRGRAVAVVRTCLEAVVFAGLLYLGLSVLFSEANLPPLNAQDALVVLLVSVPLYLIFWKLFSFVMGAIRQRTGAAPIQKSRQRWFFRRS